MNKAIVMVVAASLTACGVTQKHYKNVRYPSYRQAEFDKDNYECQRENTYQRGVLVPGAGGPVGVSQPYTDDNMVAQCLRVRGWQEVR